MGLADDYITLDATALADLVRQRQVSPAELVEAAITRLEQVEPKLAGMAEWTLDQARRAACEPLADAPFAGVPFLLKDNMHVAAGIPYHNGSRIWRGWVPPQDSELVRRFKAAGLIILGSTKVPELSLTPVTEPRHLRPGQQPLGAGPHHRRLIGRIGGPRCSPLGADGSCHRWRRIDPDPGVLLWPLRAQAHPRTHSQWSLYRRGLAWRRHRPCGDPQRPRFCPPAGCDCRT